MKRSARVRTVSLLRRAPWRRIGRGALGGLAGIGLALALAWVALPDATIDVLRFARPLDVVTVVDRDGRPLRVHRPGEVDARWATIDEISPALIDAFVAAEDQRFDEHHGLDGVAIARALWGNVSGERLSGASTITQQLVKLVYGRPHGLWDKPLEMARALELETRMSKDEILEQYLNRVPMGNGIVGVARAAEAYFGRDVSELTLAEAALLAAIPQAPSATEPRRHLDRALRRRGYVLDRLAATSPERLRSGTTRADIAAAREDVPRVVSEPPRAWAAPRFVDRVLSLRAERELTGATVRTTLDRELTEDATALLADAVAARCHRGLTNAAAIAIDVRTGAVRIHVGAAVPEGEGGALDLLRAARQPGSTLKPFAYEAFFESGASPATLVSDSAGAMVLGDGTSFVARDYDGHERGDVRARVALSASLNLAAIDVVRRTGPSRFVDALSEVGFSGAGSADRESAALVLGGIDVTAMELARAYAVLASGGRAVELRWLEQDLPTAPDGAPILDPLAVALTVDVLRDGAARADAFGSSLEDEAGGPFALKTGTSEGFHDAWCAAFDERFVVVVWMGSPARTAMDHVSGFEAAAPAAARILGALRETEPLASPAMASPAPTVALSSALVCPLTGELVGPGCTHAVMERFAPGREPIVTCDGRHDAPPPPTAPRWRPRPAPWVVVDRTRPTVWLTAEGATSFEVDGAPLLGASWRPTLGAHDIVPVGLGGRGEVAHVEVRLVGDPDQGPMR